MKVTYTIRVEDETDSPTQADFEKADGSPDTDRINEIIMHRERGEGWAWCRVTVVASLHDFTGEAYLGGCSYFVDSDPLNAEGVPASFAEVHLRDLKKEAFAELMLTLGREASRGETAKLLLNSTLEP